MASASKQWRCSWIPGPHSPRDPGTCWNGWASPVESTYTAELADGSRVERTRGRTVIRLEGKEFPTPVTFGEDGEQNLLGAMALEDAMLAVDPHSRRLIPVDALEMTGTAE